MTPQEFRERIGSIQTTIEERGAMHRLVDLWEASIARIEAEERMKRLRGADEKVSASFQSRVVDLRSAHYAAVHMLKEHKL